MSETGPIVVKIGGTALEDQASSPILWKAIAELHRTHPTGLVLVHGGGKAADRHLDRLGFKTDRRDGIRITPEDQIDEIASVLAGRVNKLLAAQLCAAGAKAVGVCLGDGDAVRCIKATRYSFDPGRVGEVTAPGNGPSDGRGDGGMLRLLAASGYLPVVSSIGYDGGGKLLNVNADDAAAALARILSASALFLMTDVPGILNGRKELVKDITPAGIERMISEGEIHGGMIPKARAAAEVAVSTGSPVIILSGNDQTSLADWIAGRPAGTKITPA